MSQAFYKTEKLGSKYQSNVALGHVRLQADQEKQFLSMNRQAGEQAID